MMNNWKKEILSIHKDAFRGLHGQEGFDFEKYVGVIKQQGKFTLNQVTKTLDTIGVSLDEYRVIIALGTMFDPEKKNHYKYGLKYIILNKYNTFSIDSTARGFYYNDLGNFNRKADFEEVRKNPEVTAYIIFQKKSDITFPKDKDLFLEPWERVKIKSITNGYVLNYIDKNEIRDCYHLPSYLDKSGYNVVDARRRLECKAREIKANREKQAFLNQDYSHKVNALQELIKSLKAECIKMLQEAESYDEVKKITSKLDGWHGYKGIVSDFEDYKRGIENKTYSSIESAERDYNSLMKVILNFNNL